MLSIIVAISENNAIGVNGGLLCHLSEDLKHFKNVTSGHAVIMGRKTYLSLPRRPLPNRRNIVLTHGTIQDEGVETASSVEQCLGILDPQEESFVIGGSSVYEQFMPYADKLYLTRMHHAWQEADTFFPDIELGKWEKISSERRPATEENPFEYSFEEYILKK